MAMTSPATPPGIQALFASSYAIAPRKHDSKNTITNKYSGHLEHGSLNAQLKISIHSNDNMDVGSQWNRIQILNVCIFIRYDMLAYLEPFERMDSPHCQYYTISHIRRICMCNWLSFLPSACLSNVISIWRHKEQS